MKLTKIAAVTAVSALALSALAACGGSDNAKADSGSKTITLWFAGKADTPPKVEAVLAKEFAAKYPGNTLKIVHVDWPELLPRLNTALQSDKTPDVVEVGNTQAATFTSVGAFTDLTSKVSQLGSSIGPKSFVDAGTYDGKVSAVPYYWGSRYIFYSKSAFKKAGIAVPTTLDGFDKAAEQLKSTGDSKYSGLWLPGHDWRNGISWIFANGGNIATQDGGKWVGQLESPESVKGLTELQALYGKATTAPKDGEDVEPWTSFNNGEAAMFMAPSWARWSVDKKHTADLGGFALPGVDGGAAPVFAGGSNLGISAKSKNQKMAFNVLKLIYGDDYQKALATNGLGPANDSFTSLMGTDEFAKSAIAAASNSKLTPASPEWATVETSKVMEEFFGKIAAGDDVATAAKATDAKLNTMLNK
jgi:N,N'-diacetylchitobiose transport system substrate-binding protein